MKLFRQRKTLLFIACMSLIVFITACGKDDPTQSIAGHSYKAIQDGKVEATFTFEKDGTLKMVSAPGKFNAGEEARANYEVVKEDNKSYLIVNHEPIDFFTKKEGFSTAYYEKDHDFYSVCLIKFDKEKITLKDSYNKKNNAFLMKNKEDIKNLVELPESKTIFDLEPIEQN
ncbi:hypothetical protein ACUXJ9_002475 [Staphylococcus caledonicus]|uniref:hypothetical protein n=1 Tax=Staphylococcus TaxID=1279 RepID=UPI001F5A65D2|nr:hypothetical protein [Staphylococcus sp. acrmy]MCI2948318.1 hypothetical protein [Staphylococcus sp. acrmy]